jgi:hypothetical protein
LSYQSRPDSMRREVSRWLRIGRDRDRRKRGRKTLVPNCIYIVGSHPAMARKIRLHRSHRLLCRIGVVVVVVVVAVAAAAPGNRQDLSTVRERERDETRLRIHCCGNGSVQTPRGYQGQPSPPK